MYFPRALGSSFIDYGYFLGVLTHTFSLEHGVIGHVSAQLNYRIRDKRTPTLYSFLGALKCRIICILLKFVLKKRYFRQESGVLFKMAF